MNRADLIKLTRLRLREARTLLVGGNFEGAYYLCGYVVECALKACIAKQTRRHEFPDKKTVDKSYTHELSDLVRVAGLKRDLEQMMRSDSLFSSNWQIAKDWEAKSRYEFHSETEARDLYKAITSRTHGVLPWIRRHW